MESIDQAGVQRMCRNALTLKQTLGSITSSREIALDHAMSFYEMLYKDPQVRVTTPYSCLKLNATCVLRF